MKSRPVWNACMSLLVAAVSLSAQATTPESYQQFLGLYEEWTKSLVPDIADGVPDYTPAAIGRYRERLDSFLERIAAIDTTDWSVSQRADRLIVKAEMNAADFNHRVVKPWAFDPGFYAILPQFQETMYVPLRVPRLPAPAGRIEELQAQLQAVPKILAQARENLTDPAADLATLAVEAKKRESARLQALAKGLAEHHPELAPDAEAARKAVEDYRAWLEDEIPGLNPRAGIGKQNYTWLFQNVYLVPYSWEEVMTICKRELERATAALAIERHKNRNLPPLELINSEEEYQKVFLERQQYLLNFLREQEIMTIPPYMDVRPAGSWNRGEVRDYFEQTQDRDPLALMPHDFVGHSPDAERTRRETPEIRRHFTRFHVGGIRADGFATAVEEILMNAGLHDERPRVREVVYNLVAFRAARAIADLEMHSNEFSLQDAFDYIVEATPDGWVPPDSPVVAGDLDLYLRQPGYGTAYIIGAVQTNALLAERAMQLGDRFDLKEFLDEYLASGVIPISLIRWEMTGREGQLDRIWSQ